MQRNALGSIHANANGVFHPCESSDFLSDFRRRDWDGESTDLSAAGRRLHLVLQLQREKIEKRKAVFNNSIGFT